MSIGKLKNYCEENGITKGEAIRKGIDLLLEEKNNDNAAHRKQSDTVTTTNPQKKSAKSIIAFLSWVVNKKQKGI